MTLECLHTPRHDLTCQLQSTPVTKRLSVFVNTQSIIGVSNYTVVFHRCDVILGRLKSVIGMKRTSSPLEKADSTCEDRKEEDTKQSSSKHEVVNGAFDDVSNVNETTPLSFFLKNSVERTRSGSNITISTFGTLTPEDDVEHPQNGATVKQ